MEKALEDGGIGVCRFCGRVEKIKRYIGSKANRIIKAAMKKIKLMIKPQMEKKSTDRRCWWLKHRRSVRLSK